MNKEEMQLGDLSLHFRVGQERFVRKPSRNLCLFVCFLMKNVIQNVNPPWLKRK